MRILVDLKNNGGCGAIGCFILVLDIVMTIEKFSGGLVLFSESVLSSSGSMSHCISNGSRSRDFDKWCQLRLLVLPFTLVTIWNSEVPAIFYTWTFFHITLSQALMISSFAMGGDGFDVWS